MGGGPSRATGRRDRPAAPAPGDRQFKRWTARELDLRREAASASELAEAMGPNRAIASRDRLGPHDRPGDDDRLDRRHQDCRSGSARSPPDMTCQALARTAGARSCGRRSAEGFFHADMHQGNLFVLADGDHRRDRFRHHGADQPAARQWLAEILYGLITGNYRASRKSISRRNMCPAIIIVDEFATALRAVGEPMRGKPVSELSVGQDARRAVRHHPRFRHADPAAPAAAAKDDGDGRRRGHLARSRHQHVGNSRPLCEEWLRDELGPEAKIADPFEGDTRCPRRRANRPPKTVPLN
jgi:ubiquinone biosynthesis protein